MDHTFLTKHRFKSTTVMSFGNYSEEQHRSAYIVAVSGVCLFVLSGLASSYLYYTLRDEYGIWLPGAIFISATVLYFLLIRSRANILQLLVYCVLMIAPYLALFFVTYLSASFSVVVGFVTGGLGAMATFALIKNCIIPFQFRPFVTFGIGALAWGTTTLVELGIERNLSSCLFDFARDDFQAPYGDIFIVWQILVGVLLVFKLPRGVAGSR